MTDTTTTALIGMVPTIVAADVVGKVAHAVTKPRTVKVVKVVVVKKASRKLPKMKYPKMGRVKQGRTIISKNVYRSKSGAMSHRRVRGSKRVRYS
jgi:hypothetical protein